MAFKQLEGRLTKVSLIDKRNPSIGITIKISEKEKLEIKNYFDSEVYQKLKNSENIRNISITLERYFRGKDDTNPEYKMNSLIIYKDGGIIIDKYFNRETDKREDIIENYKNK
jgi:hypothetical protein